jgi:hypothetical protein
VLRFDHHVLLSRTCSCTARHGTRKLDNCVCTRACQRLTHSFLCAGVPDEKAVVITAATVASKARSALVDGCASYREGDMTEVMIQLLRLAGLLNAFPPALGSAESEAVGASLQQTFTLEERQAIFLTYGGMDYPTAGTLAEMLGFDPELVMPQLHAHLTGTA